jgi:hypothetical protein
MTEIEKQGEYGEVLVNKFLTEKLGTRIIRNPDKYGTWDSMAVDGKGVEHTFQIKACTRYITKKSFRFHIGPTGRALDTIKQCDHLICVVRNPPTMKDWQYAGKIVRILDHTKYNLSSDGTLWIPSNDKTTEVLGSITAEELAHLDSFKTSKNVL